VPTATVAMPGTSQRNTIFDMKSSTQSSDLACTLAAESGERNRENLPIRPL
jgi:hypothetical protein